MGMEQIIGVATIVGGLIMVYVRSTNTDREHEVRLHNLEQWREKYEEKIDKKLDAIIDAITELKIKIGNE